jgi:hypothetical protein
VLTRLASLTRRNSQRPLGRCLNFSSFLSRFFHLRDHLSFIHFGPLWLRWRDRLGTLFSSFVFFFLYPVLKLGTAPFVHWEDGLWGYLSLLHNQLGDISAKALIGE